MAVAEKILVVVDPTAADQPAASRGAMLARQLDCCVELFICHYDPQLAGGRLFAAAEREEMRAQELRHQIGYLNDLARGLDTSGQPVTSKVVWDTPLAEGIVREVLRSEPRLVLKDTHHHSAISRSLFTNTDWHLIRDCPAPLWLVKPTDWAAGPVIAAVDPLHEHDKPARLDERITAEARHLAEALGGELHVYHGYDTAPAIARAGTYTMSPTPVPVEEIVAKVETAHREGFEKLTRSLDIDQAHAHLVAGAAAEVLPALARKLSASLIVMGAVARARLQHAIVGSTAERVLDNLPCDVLVIKPEHFESAVTYKAQAREFQQLTNTD